MQVVKGILFKLVDTHGLPLVMALEVGRQKGMIYDMLEFIISAYQAGWKPRTIIARIYEAHMDLYGYEVATACKRKTEQILEIYCVPNP